MIIEKFNTNRNKNWYLRNANSTKVGYGRKLYQFKKDLTVIDNAEEFVFDQFLNSKQQTITIIPNILLFNVIEYNNVSTNNSNTLSTAPPLGTYFSVSIGYFTIKNKYGTTFEIKHEILGKLAFIKNTNPLYAEGGVNIFTKLESKEPEANLAKLEEICKKHIESFYDEYMRTYPTLKYKLANNAYALSTQLVEFMTINSDKFVTETKTGTLDKNVLEKVQKIVAEIKEENKKEITV